LLSPILDRLIDRKHDRLTGMRLHFVAVKGMPVAIHLQVQLARLAADLFVVVLLDSAQTNLVGAHKTKYVRAQRIVRIEALWFGSRIDSGQGLRIQLRAGLRIHPANYPEEFLVGSF